ncbi:MerR family transcriptional regulator [Endomicrobium proavitum]|uniref:Putative MerR family transcriptional regulator n=1 Tax=Endomicrobium proavitum TaxID=1408281 RepID=A0A0G3WGW7_9BACT|nr:MerR family transcriptional regulator [Endomicrobium proavitum]AKL97916.1 putative MerR family transcriptional regulator [Endomicrobium proavitum]
METLQIPDKEYFSIGEVSQITQVVKHTLRYWESEFKLLRPARKSSGQRRYRKEDLELVFKIKDLLYNKRYTIEGVKKYLLADKRKKQIDLPGTETEHSPDSKILRELKEELKQILKLLKK